MIMPHSSERISQPVSRQHEAEYMGYYGYPYYWGGPNLWGPAFHPAGVAISTTASTEAIADKIRSESTDSHLRGRADSKVYVGLSQEAMRSGPEYDDSTPITREYENRLYLHYGEPPYWLQEAGRPPVFRRA